MLSFDIRPYTGALPLSFGISRAEVHRVLGTPQVASPPLAHRGYSDSWDDGNIQIGYDANLAVNHIGFGPGEFALSLCGSPLWTTDEHPDPISALLQQDPDPWETLGFLVFDRIGITTTGYHDQDDNDLSLCLYPRGKWDKSLQKATRPDLSRYRTTGSGRA